MADIFTEALKKLDEELGGNKVGKAMDQAMVGGAAPKKEETKVVTPPKPVPAKPADPLAGLSNDDLKKRLAALNEQLKQAEAQKAAKLAPIASSATTKVDDFDIDEYISSILKDQGASF